MFPPYREPALIFGMYICTQDGGLNRDLYSHMITRDESGKLFEERSTNHIFPKDSRILFTPSLRSPARLMDRFGVNAAIGIPRGYSPPFVVEHRATDTLGLDIKYHIPKFRYLERDDGFMGSLHKINSHGSESFLGSGFIAISAVAVEIANKGSQRLFIAPAYRL